MNKDLQENHFSIEKIFKFGLEQNGKIEASQKLNSQYFFAICVCGAANMMNVGSGSI